MSSRSQVSKIPDKQIGPISCLAPESDRGDSGSHDSANSVADVADEADPDCSPPRHTFPPHITPCSPETFHYYRDVFGPRVELVDGLLINLNEMVDDEHVRIAKLFSFFFQLCYCYTDHKLVSYNETDLNIVSVRKAVKRIDRQIQQAENDALKDTSPPQSNVSPSIPGTRAPSSHQKQRRSALCPESFEIGASSSSSHGSPYRNEKNATIRVPDVTAANYREALDRDTRGPSCRPTFDEDYIPRVVVEVTSPSTREVDLIHKWAEFCRTGVDHYIVVDRHKEHIIWGALDNKHCPLAKQCATGDPEFDREPQPRRGAKPSTSISLPRYYRTVFRKDTKFRFPLFNQLHHHVPDNVDWFNVSYILKPEQSEELRRQVRAFEKAKAEEERARLQEKQKQMKEKAEEERRLREREREKRKRQEARAKQYREVLKEKGFPVTPSPPHEGESGSSERSPTKSPVQQRRRKHSS